MRKPKHLLPVAMALSCLCLTNTNSFAATNGDSAKITHVLDGYITEWRADKFEIDKETNVAYAVDHDANNLHIAMKITDPQVQMKMMITGMNLYLDKKGKRREGLGVQFPIRNESGMAGARGNGGGRPDPKEMRDRLVSNMIFLKTFGFEDEDKTQLISQENAINVAFSFDDASVMYIEYQVPLSLLGKTSDLNGKPIGIGWKINVGAQVTSTEVVAVPSSGGRGGGGGGGGARGGARGNGASPSPDMSGMMREQNIWTKYNLVF